MRSGVLFHRLVFLSVFTFAANARPSTAGRQGFSQIDEIIQGGIAAKKFPGAVVIVGHNGQIVFHRAYGNRSLEPQPESHFGWFAMFVDMDMPASSSRTQQLVRWLPSGPGLIRDLERSFSPKLGRPMQA